MIGTVRRGLKWIGSHELADLLAVSTIALGALVFVETWSRIRHGHAMSVDRLLLLSLRSESNPAVPIGPRWLEGAVRDVTALGSVTVLTLITVSAASYLAMKRQPRAALFLVASVVSAAVLASLLKAAVGRTRPDVVPHLVAVDTSSFPSGHSMVSAAVYFTIGTILARLEANLAMKAYILAWAALLSFLVGMSRVYLGVHWPSDVLAGWAAGSGWAAVCFGLARLLQRRGEVEAPTASAAGQEAP
jgi:undecaprenyl-diphosphatase